ncbi:MAG TPA: discoidin domain-containing protein [Chitinophagales bacterium]|nr:discoidin domain-containing protein [Chitinophagales bacterium]
MCSIIQKMTKHYIPSVFSLLTAFSISAFAQWNPYAGVIPSYTWNATVTASSGDSGAEVIDHNENTNWQSDAPLPNGFLSKAEQNVFLNICSSGKCKSSGNAHHAETTDGNLKTSAHITGNAGAWFEINLLFSSSFRSFSVKCAVTAPLYLFAYQANNDSTIISKLSEADNYKLKRMEVKLSSVKKIKLFSSGSFQLFEIAAISQPLKEYVTVDLGAAKTIGWIETKHWAGGKAAESELLGSTDNIRWFPIARLDPKAVNILTTRLKNPVTAKYLRVQHTLVDEDYAKVFVWEVNVWDAFGPYGQMPAAKKSSSTVAEIIGVNGLWGWGYGICSDHLMEGQGPGKFSKVATHARSYHNWHWDVTDPDNIPDYSQMTDSGTQALNWLNWDREYSAWRKAGLKVTASIQFEQKKMPQIIWNNPYQCAYNYAYAFAKHFGPTYGNGLVQAMEAGNEPWDYPSAFYAQVLEGFAKGAKAADPKMIVLPCALQSAFPHEETERGGNFSGARITQESALFIDGLNVHHYSYAYNEQGRRVGVNPEHSQSSIRAILNDIRFRDANLPGKKIYVTEWGWDSDGAGEACTHSECVTEKTQALYAVRGAMFFIRLGADRLCWFNYANGKGGLYSRSGLTGSPAAGFAEKISFRALQALLAHLGGCYFLDVMQENDEAWIYKFGDAKGRTTHLIAWKPVSGEDDSVSAVHLPAGYAPESAWLISGTSSQVEMSLSLASFNPATQVTTLKVSAVPVVVKLKMK